MMQSRLKAWLVVLAIWAVIYLPFLGRQELVGHEPIRVLPAVSMLQAGNWILPEMGGAPYYNKPPGFNWLVAASFRLTGHASEFTARLPSALLVLAFCSMLVLMRSTWLDGPGRLVSALVFLTCVGIIDSGRKAELEASYVCMTGMAILCWANVWQGRGSRWLMWLAPACFLAFGALIKGPILGVVFYLAVCCILGYAHRWKDLLALPHLVAVLLILFICLGWVYLAFQRAPGDVMLSQWAEQWLIRISPTEEHMPNWFLDIPKAFGKFAPWVLLAPLLWIPRFVRSIPSEHLPLFKGLRLGTVLCAAVLILIPYNVPRYCLPTLPAFALLMGWMLSRQSLPLPSDRIWKWVVLVSLAVLCVAAPVGVLIWQRNLVGLAAAILAIALAGGVFRLAGRLECGRNLALASVVAMAVAMLLVNAFTGKWENKKTRPIAAAINRQVPPGQTLVAFRPGFQGLLFYLRAPIVVMNDPRQLDDRVHYVLIRTKVLEQPDVRDRLGGRIVATKYRFHDRLMGEEQVLELKTAASTLPTQAGG